MTARHAMTLIEVVLAMGLIAIGVITVAMALPATLRIQERTRFQLYAAGKALELVDRFLGEPQSTGIGGTFTFEANRPWDVPTGRRVLDPDLELRTCIQRGSLFPVPPDIAYRLDSPDDEIRRILDAGGQIYYSNPVSAHPLKGDNPLQPRPPNEAMKLLIGVVGDPQQNAIQQYPWKGWPYYSAYPAPPTDFNHTGDENKTAHNDHIYREILEYDTQDLDGDGFPDIDSDLLSAWKTDFTDLIDVTKPSTGTFDYDGRPTDWTLPPYSGFRNLSTITSLTGRGGNNSNTDRNNYLAWIQTCGWNQAKGQLMLALWYGWRSGLPAQVLYGHATSADITAMTAVPRQVRAMRYLAFAGDCMTKWFPLDPEPAGTDPPRSAHDGLRQGILLPGDDDEPGIPNRLWPMIPCPNLMDLLAKSGLADGMAPNPFDPANLEELPGGHPATSPGRSTHFDWTGLRNGHMAVRLPMIQNWHETCMAVVMRHATINPYNWSEPRPLNRQLFSDHPLLQWDVCAPLSEQLQTDANGILGTKMDAALSGFTPVAARMWRPIAAQPITNIGFSAPVKDGGVYFNGNDLARDADAAYTSIHGDPRRFNLNLPFQPGERCRQLVFWAVDWTSYEDWETAKSAPVDAARFPRRVATDVNSAFTSIIKVQENPNGAGSAYRGIYDTNAPVYRNPEKARSFILDLSGFPTGSNILYYTAGLDGGHNVSQTEASAYAFRSEAGGDPTDKRVDMYCENKTYPATLAGTPTNPKHPYWVFCGLFGADRNGNSRLDRGPLPASVRLRAVEVARINFYDPRLGFSLR